jgi:hypothetical protein
MLFGSLVMRVDGAVFFGAFGFVVAGAAAAFGCWVSGDVGGELVKEGFSAIGDAALDDFEGAAFADGGPGLPIRVDAQGTDFAQAGGGEFGEGFEEEAGDAGGAGGRGGRC